MQLRDSRKRVLKIAVLGLLLLVCIGAVLLGMALQAGGTESQDYQVFQHDGVQAADKDQQIREQLETRLTEAVNAVDGVESTIIQISGGQEQPTVKAELTLRSGYALSEEQRAGIEALIQNSTGSETVEIQIA